MKSVVLLSGGLDSTTNLYQATKESEVLLALTFDYGQRAVKKEILAAENLCKSLGVKHKILSIPWIKDFGHSSLTNSLLKIPQGKDVSIDNYEQSLKTASSVWVPNRNGILLNIAAGFAESLGAQQVIPGFNLEEAQTFPDNSEDYLKALTQSLSFSTANKVITHCYTTSLDKTEMVALAIKLNVPFELLWPCYFDESKWCGHCESCLRFKRALTKNNILDQYQSYFN